MSSSDSEAPAGRAPTTANASAAWVSERSVARGAGPASAGRVAQAGNGNSTTRGTGSSGWLTNMVPGLAITARARWAGGVGRVADGDLGAPGGIHTVRRPGGQVPADQPGQVFLRADQATGERVDRTEPDRRTGPVRPGLLVVDLRHHEVHEVGVGT